MGGGGGEGGVGAPHVPSLLYGSDEVEKSKFEREFAFLSVLNLFIASSTIFLFHITKKVLLSVNKLYSSL